MQNIKLQTSYTTIKGKDEGEIKYKSYQAEYSEMGQVLLEESFDKDGNIIESFAYAYDEDGFLIEEKKEIGTTQSTHYLYTYDEFGRMIKKERRRDDKVIMSTITELEDLKETETTTGPSGLIISKIDRIFSEEGRLVEIIEYQEDDTPLYNQKFSYDLDGNLTMAEYFDEKEELMELHIRDFDEDGRVIRFEKQNNEGHILQQELYTYEDPGMLIKLEKLSETIAYTYNELGNEKTITEFDKDGNTKRVRNFDYDEFGMLVEEVIEDKLQESTATVNTDFEYFLIEERQA